MTRFDRFALVARPFRCSAAPPPLGLNAHLRRDIGLPSLEDGGPRRVGLRYGRAPPLHPLAGRGGGR